MLIPSFFQKSFFDQTCNVFGFNRVFLVALFIAACGGGGGSGDASTPAANPPNPPNLSNSSLALHAGDMRGGPGNNDGTGPAARFNKPAGIAVDNEGNIYVADFFNNIIRKITPAGVVTTLAGAAAKGSTDATGTAARFALPSGVATDSAGNVYVADSGFHTIRKITPAGAVTTLAGTANQFGSTDATGAAARFGSPHDVATDTAGNIYVADNGNHTIRKVTPAGVVTTLAGTAQQAGSADGTGAAARFHNPSGIATDTAGNIYVADQLNHTIRKIAPGGVVTTLAGTAGQFGSTDATGPAARFAGLRGLGIDGAGNVYAANGHGTIRKITPAGVVTTVAGTAGQVGSIDATGASARFNSPSDVATDSAGNLYVADQFNNTIRKITPEGAVTTLAGTVPQFGSTDATGAAARFANPTGIATDRAGNAYIADSGNNTIRKITPAGVVTTFAGAAGQGGSIDATGAAARFGFPQGVATDSADNVYVADSGNATIRKITPAGEVTTFAGAAAQGGSIDATAAAARFRNPSGLAIDNAGNVYVADTGNTTIRKITPAGVVTTLAGTAGQPGFTDATGPAARFASPTGVATDSAGNVYVAESAYHTIRKITPAGVVTTLAGTAPEIGSTDATGAAARFYAPTGIATDSVGNVYVADSQNYTIRKITPAGVVTTVGGVAGRADFMPGPSPGLLGFPLAVAVSDTSLYIVLYNGVAVVRVRP